MSDETGADAVYGTDEARWYAGPAHPSTAPSTLGEVEFGRLVDDVTTALATPGLGAREVAEVLSQALPFLTVALGGDLRALLLELHRPALPVQDRVLCEHDLHEWPCPTAQLCHATASR